MIRKTTVNLNYANSGKLNQVRDFLDRYTYCVNQFIDLLWEIKRFSGVFVERAVLDQINCPITFNTKQSAAQTALHIVKSQRKKKKKVKPIFRGTSFELDQRFIQIHEGTNDFDLWIRIGGLSKIAGKHCMVFLPTKKHKHFNKLSNEGWELKKSIRLRIKDSGKLYADLFFEKEVEKKQEGNIIGLDCGYKKLAILSTGQMVGTELVQKIEKIAKKKHGSKAFKRALIERNEYMNREVKKIDLSNLKAIIIEDLKGIKKNTKGKIRRKFMNKLQRWTYPYFFNRLEQACEVVGVQCHKINPAYTSQECSNCGSIHKENRKAELFKCVVCGHTADADFNASLNILNRFLTGVSFEPC